MYFVSARAGRHGSLQRYIPCHNLAASGPISIAPVHVLIVWEGRFMEANSVLSVQHTFFSMTSALWRKLGHPVHTEVSRLNPVRPV